MVRKGGFEPPRLSAPPPQDGVSASSTTSALQSSICRPFEGNRSLHGTAGHTAPASCFLSLYTRSNEAVQVRWLTVRLKPCPFKAVSNYTTTQCSVCLHVVADAFIVRCDLDFVLYEWSHLF